MKVRMWAPDMRKGAELGHILEAEFESINGKIVIRASNKFIKNWKEKGAIYEYDDIDREHPFWPEDGDAYLETLATRPDREMLYDEDEEEDAEA